MQREERLPRVGRIVENALYVTDKEASARFYQRLFGFATLLQDDRLHALDVTGLSVLLLFEKGKSNQPNPVPGGVIPAHDGLGRLHLAFSISGQEIERWEGWLAENGVVIESRVYPPGGGVSLYFRDPDGHLIELASPGIWPTY